MPAPRSIDPVLPRKGPIGSPGIFLLIAVAILCSAYALGYLPHFGSLLEKPSLVFYGVAGVVAFLVLLVLLRSLDLAVRKTGDTTPFADRRYKTIARYVAEATDQGISLRVARESYHLLQHFYPGKMCAELNDDLDRDLGISEEALSTLHAGLLHRCDRQESTKPELAALNTVLDLLLSIEAARLNHFEHSISRGGSEGRLSASSGQHGVAHPYNSRSRTTPRLSGLHRRASDYNGPRRRATDRRATAAYTGALRRAHERTTRILEGESNSAANRHNHQDAPHVPPRNRRGPPAGLPKQEPPKDRDPV
jgi:hypothetical protein